MKEIHDIYRSQTENRWRVSATTSYQRISKLLRLKQEVLARREEIKQAMYRDFKKPEAEVELTEIHPVIDEINFAVSHLKKWMRPVKVSTPITLLGSRSEIHYEAKGVVLILAPWNYPFSLVLNPLVAAIAAGNCVIAKPSEKTPHTSALLKKMIEAIFPANEVAIVEGGLHTSQVLLDIPFDHIFFTGSINVGKVVMSAAAKHLASVTLELGGKSPVIIDREVDLELAVERIAWGKLLNGGQTCVAPDYVFVPVELKDQFVELFKKYYQLNYKNDESLARLIDKRAFERLHQKIEREENLLGGTHVPEENFLAPTLIQSDLKSAIMEDEIFGPILPLITYTKIEEVIESIRSQSKPLALYVFSNNKTFIHKVTTQTTSGGLGINQVILHLANPHLPFGGVGFSGQGSYHGIFGFKAFSHEKAVIRQGKWSLIKMYFPPYNTWWSKMAFKLLHFLE